MCGILCIFMFKPLPNECKTCGKLLTVYTVYRHESHMISYVCVFHDHEKNTEGDKKTVLSFQTIQRHLFRPEHEGGLLKYDFDYDYIIKYFVKTVFLSDRGEHRYIDNRNASTVKNVYRMYNGLCLRDYFEEGMWMLADKNIKGVWVWRNENTK